MERTPMKAQEQKPTIEHSSESDSSSWRFLLLLLTVIALGVIALIARGIGLI
jgi:hypothetical protein